MVELEEGRRVVANDSVENAPVSTVFASVFAMRVRTIDTRNNLLIFHSQTGVLMSF